MAYMALPPPTIDDTVLITGASSWIGAELALELAKRNYNLVLVARRAERLQELADSLRLSHGIHDRSLRVPHSRSSSDRDALFRQLLREEAAVRVGRESEQ